MCGDISRTKLQIVLAKSQFYHLVAELLEHFRWPMILYFPNTVKPYLNQSGPTLKWVLWAVLKLVILAVHSVRYNHESNSCVGFYLFLLCNPQQCLFKANWKIRIVNELNNKVTCWISLPKSNSVDDIWSESSSAFHFQNIIAKLYTSQLSPNILASINNTNNIYKQVIAHWRFLPITL